MNSICMIMLNGLIISMLCAMDDRALNCDWDWYITHLDLSIETKKIACSITHFDPAVRIYDNDSKKLIVSLQRLTDYGTNTDFPDKDVSREGYKIKDKDVMRIDILDNNKKIITVEVGGEKNILTGYDIQEQPAFVIDTMDYVKQAGGLIGVFSRTMSGDTDYALFFRRIREKKQVMRNLKEKLNVLCELLEQASAK